MLDQNEEKRFEPDKTETDQGKTRDHSPAPADQILVWTKRQLKKLPGFFIARLFRDQLRERYGAGVRGLSPLTHEPMILMLETSSLCNLACEKCGHKTSTRPQGLMDTPVALDLVDQAADMGVKRVCLSMLGEPLLHPELERIIVRIKERGLNSHMVTNGLLLSPERSMSLIEAGLDAIEVSIDGWDQASYADRQAGADLNRALDNLDRFREIRGPERRPRLVSITVLDTFSRRHLAEIRRSISSHVDISGVAPLIDYGISGHQVAPELLLGKRSWKRIPCGNLWSTLNVGWDGRVSACCNDHNFLLAYHDVKDAPLKELWNCQTIQEWRQLHLGGKLERMPMCGRCTCDYARSLAFSWIKYKFDNAQALSSKQGQEGGVDR